MQTVTRSARRVRIEARAPRAIAALVACVLMIAGARATLQGVPEAVVVAPAAGAGDPAAEALAEGFTRAYLSWDPARPELRERALTRFGGGGLELGVEAQAQKVEWTAVVGSEAGRTGRVVTVAADAGGRMWHLAVPVRRDRAGSLRVANEPAVVGPPPLARSDAAAGSEREVEDPGLRSVAERAIRNYIAGERDDLLADLDPGASVSMPSVTGEVRSVDGVTWAERGHVAVRVEVSVGETALMLRYELWVVRRDRWFVREVVTDARALPNPGSPR